MSTAPLFDIARATTADHLAAAKVLFRAYAASLDVDLAYQDFARELAALPGAYAPPTGALLLAWRRGEALGCIALRPWRAPDLCEMKRLYVRPEARGLRLGRALIDALVAEARCIGYREMRLDTLPSMIEAQTLYRRLGFEEIKAYYASPIADTVFMRLRL